MRHTASSARSGGSCRASGRAWGCVLRFTVALFLAVLGVSMYSLHTHIGATHDALLHAGLEGNSAPPAHRGPGIGSKASAIDASYLQAAASAAGPSPAGGNDDDDAVAPQEVDHDAPMALTQKQAARQDEPKPPAAVAATANAAVAPVKAPAKATAVADPDDDDSYITVFSTG